MLDRLKIWMEKENIRDELFDSIYKGIKRCLNENYPDPTKLLKEYYKVVVPEYYYLQYLKYH